MNAPKVEMERVKTLDDLVPWLRGEADEYVDMWGKQGAELHRIADMVETWLFDIAAIRKRVEEEAKAPERCSKGHNLVGVFCWTCYQGHP